MEEKNDGVGKPSQEEEDILFTKGLKKKGGDSHDKDGDG
jgi:hypothetical protein